MDKQDREREMERAIEFSLEMLGMGNSGRVSRKRSVMFSLGFQGFPRSRASLVREETSC